ncbi:ATP-grasp domain-containing protein [Psychroserpens sp. Hel_I_66]|uniref:ATP-grasp domain-containing protein n=1 Tax=Psychroserpens sp. Hel_I_66 TaxID=1250004 RepID=UPI00064806CC|nr:ATP-grasp domain-containing protein [Psychroserpens sp. Hel_I_66]
MKLNILFTCSGRRNYLINYFKTAINNNGKIFAADINLSAPSMVDADVAILVPSVYSENYIAELKNIIEDHKIDAIISLNDLELPILSKHKQELESLGTKVIISSEKVIDISFDKIETFKFLKSIGLETPLTYTTLEVVKNALTIKKIDFPLVVKPRWGSGSIGVDFVESIEELELAFKLQHLKLKKSILNTVSLNDADHAILIQEKINGKEYGMDVLNDFENNYYGSFAREKYSMRCGETDKAISIIDDRFEKIGQKIASNLKHMGTLDCDFFVTKDKIYVLELNPRFGGGYPFSHQAGINTAAIYIEWLKGNNDVDQFNNYKPNKLFSKCDNFIQINNFKKS